MLPGFVQVGRNLVLHLRQGIDLRCDAEAHKQQKRETQKPHSKWVCRKGKRRAPFGFGDAGNYTVRPNKLRVRRLVIQHRIDDNARPME